LTALEHYILSGCYGRGDLNVFLLAGFVMRGHVEGLARAWEDLAPRLRRHHPAPYFAEVVLAAADAGHDRASRFHRVGKVIEQYGPCTEHGGA
jgi:hypothetical protein